MVIERQKIGDYEHLQDSSNQNDVLVLGDTFLCCDLSKHQMAAKSCCTCIRRHQQEAVHIDCCPKEGERMKIRFDLRSGWIHALQKMSNDTLTVTCVAEEVKLRHYNTHNCTIHPKYQWRDVSSHKKAASEVSEILSATITSLVGWPVREV